MYILILHLFVSDVLKISICLLLTLSPTTEKRCPYTGIGLRRPRATTIVEGMYARRRELSLVPAYEICVCEWRGAPLPILHTFLAYGHGRAILGHDDRFLLIARLLLILKGYLYMKLKVVALAISMK